MSSISNISEVIGEGPVPDGTIHGHVYDAYTKQPLSKAFVYCPEVKCSKPMTNSEGYYAIKECFSPSATYTIECRKNGYDPFGKSITTDQDGSAEVDFYLERAGEAKPKKNYLDSNSAHSSFKEYYTNNSRPIVGGIISTPLQFNISQNTPTSIHLSNGGQVAYSQHEVLPRGNELWIKGATDWSQYVMCLAGTWLQLIAFAPGEGDANFYLANFNSSNITDLTNMTSNRYQLCSSYNTMNFFAGIVGRHILQFYLNNSSSNDVTIDVIDWTPASITPEQGATGSMPPSTMPVPLNPSQQYKPTSILKTEINPGEKPSRINYRYMKVS